MPKALTAKITMAWARAFSAFTQAMTARSWATRGAYRAPRITLQRLRTILSPGDWWTISSRDDEHAHFGFGLNFISPKSVAAPALISTSKVSFLFFASGK